MKSHQKINVQLVYVLYRGEVGGTQSAAGNLGALCVDDRERGLGPLARLRNVIEIGFGARHPIKSCDFPVAIAHSAQDWQCLVIVFQRLPRLPPQAESMSKMVERYRLALAVTHSNSQLERTLQILDCLRLVLLPQKTVGGSGMREYLSFCPAVANLPHERQRRLEAFERLLRLAEKVVNVSHVVERHG